MNGKVKNILTVVVGLLVMIGLLFGVNALVTPIIEKNEMKQKIEQYSTILDGIDKVVAIEFTSDIVTDKQKAFDASDTFIGTLYNATLKNQWGEISIIMAIAPDGIIIGADAVVDQSIKPNETKQYILKHVGKNINDKAAIDAIAGPTTADSVDTTDEIITEIAKLHSGEAIDELSPLEEIFGEGATVETDATFTPDETVLAKNIVSLDGENVGFVYKIIGFGPAIDPTDEAKSITLEFALNNEGVLVGYIINKDLYNHTWSYRRNVITFLDNLITEKTNVADFEFTDIDAETGSTNTTKVVIEMLEALKGVVAND